jgi:predicted nucleotidyltransferase
MPRTSFTNGKRKGRINPRLLASAVQRVVEVSQPKKIILFGSAARGEMRCDSDLDLLVIKEGKFNRWKVAANIYRRLADLEVSVDIILATPEEVRRFGDSPYLVIGPALKEGKVVYAA